MKSTAVIAEYLSHPPDEEFKKASAAVIASTARFGSATSVFGLVVRIAGMARDCGGGAGNRRGLSPTFGGEGIGLRVRHRSKKAYFMPKSLPRFQDGSL